LAIEFLAVPGFPPLGVLPFPCTGFHGPEIKIAVVAFGRLPALKEEALRKCGFLSLAMVLIGDRERDASLRENSLPACSPQLPARLQIDFVVEALK
jgi:hypothetical protein